MKIAIVPAHLFTKDLDLRATTYVNPTQRVDREILRAEKAIRKAHKQLLNAHKRYKVLVSERDRIREGHPDSLHLDDCGRIRREDWDK